MLPSEAGEGILWFAYLSSHPRTHFMNFMEIDDGMNQLYSPGHPSPNTITGLVNQVSCLCWYLCLINSFLIVVVQLLSCVWLFVTPWTTARQASLFITNFWSLLKFMSIELGFNLLKFLNYLAHQPSQSKRGKTKITEWHRAWRICLFLLTAL